MEVIHDWADDKAAQILASVRRAAGKGAKILIVETLVSESPGPHVGKLLDGLMLAFTGGRERTSSEYEALLLPAGFRLNKITPTSSQYSIVEAEAV
jgi:O-methyltransferase domain